MEFIFYMSYFITCRGRLLGRFLAVIACILYGVGTAYGATYTCISNGSRTLTIPSMTVMRDAAIGSEIMTVSATNVVAYGCALNSTDDPSYGEYFGVRGYGVPAGQINGRNIYVLGSAATGVGYAIYAATQDVKSYITAGDNELDVLSNAKTLGSSNRTASALKLTFYKIGPITNTSVPTQLVAAFYDRQSVSSGSPGVDISPNYPIYTSGVGVLSAGCEVQRSQISVSLGSVNRSRFGGSYGDTGGEQFFSVPLVCDAGTRVRISIDSGAAGVLNANKGVINLDSSGDGTAASGVALQILQGGTPVVISSFLTMGVPGETGEYNLAFSARYFRTADKMTPGTANATATFTMSYE